MNRDELLRLLRAFETEGLEYVLVGATAMGFHGVIRATEDVDLFVRANAGNLQRLRRALRAAYGDDPSIDEIADADLLADYPSVRYYPPSGDLFIDLMTRLGDAVNYETVEAEIKDIEGIRVRVATPRALYDLKKDTVRPLDRQDQRRLQRASISRRATDVPVEKFRSAQEMNAAPPRITHGNEFERFVRHCARFRVIFRRQYPRGVFRFRNVEEAQAARMRVEATGNHPAS